jgi:HSP20 family protein
MMTIVRRPSPFGELMTLRSAMDRLFEDSFVRPRQWVGSVFEGSSLPLDVHTTADELVVKAALPGVKPDEVDITVEGGTLTISGEIREDRADDGAGYLIQEIRRGAFTRSIALPEGVEPDKAIATFENGVLTLRIPKAEQVKPRQIRISPTGQGRTETQTAGREADVVEPASAGTRG